MTEQPSKSSPRAPRSSRIEAFSRWAETITVPGRSITAQSGPDPYARKRFDGTLKAPSAEDIAEFEAWAETIPALPCSVIAQDVPYLPRMEAKAVASEPVQKHVWVTVATTAGDGKLVRRRRCFVVSHKTQQHAEAIIAMLKDMKGESRNRRAG